MSPASIALALAQLALFLAIGWVVGDRLLARIAGSETQWIGGPERTLFAIVGGVAFAIAAMVGHIVTGGGLFGVPGVVPALGLAVLVAGRRSFGRPRNVPWIPLLVLASILVVIYVVPVLVGGSGISSGDSPWHLGWSTQLLAGEAVPTGPAPGFGRNAYPWGWHAVVATLVRLVPGSDVMVAYEALHLLVLTGIPLAGACIARRLSPDAGWAGAVAVSLIGGFGWLAASGAAFATTPERARFGADLVVSSPNSVYALFPPALPRELGVVLLGACCVLLVTAAARKDKAIALGAGVVAGILGLVSVPLFVSALVWFGVVALFQRSGLRMRWLFGPALAVFALWAGPVVADYLRFGGFVDITPSLGREWPLPVALASWGLLLPAAAAGVYWAMRRTEARPLLLCLAGTAGLLVASVARATFEWELAGNATLLHQGRVWPVMHLLGAAFAGAAVVELRRTRRSRAVVVGAIAPLLFAIGVASPVLASMRVTQLLTSEHDGFVYGGDDYERDSFVRRAAEFIGPDDVVAVRGSDRIAWSLFQFTGARLATYEDPRLGGNDLRIRYRELAAEWDARIADEGFEPDYVVIPGFAGAGPGLPTITGEFDGRPWSLVPARSG